MKSLKSLFTAAVAAIAITFTLAPVEIQAGHSGNNQSYRQTSTCGHCQQPVYAQLRIVGYESCGEPIWRWVPVQHRCSGQSSRRGHAQQDPHAGHNHSSGQRGPDIGYILSRIFAR